MGNIAEEMKVETSVELPKCHECGAVCWVPCFATMDTGCEYSPVVRLCPGCWQEHCFPQPDGIGSGGGGNPAGSGAGGEQGTHTLFGMKVVYDENIDVPIIMTKGAYKAAKDEGEQ